MHDRYNALVLAFREAVEHAAERAERLPEVDLDDLASSLDYDELAGNIDYSDLSDNICLSELTDHIEIDDRVYSAVNDSLPNHVRDWFDNNESDIKCAVRDAIAWHFETRATPWRRFRSAFLRRWYSIKARFSRSK